MLGLFLATKTIFFLGSGLTLPVGSKDAEKPRYQRVKLSKYFYFGNKEKYFTPGFQGY